MILGLGMGVEEGDKTAQKKFPVEDVGSLDVTKVVVVNKVVYERAELAGLGLG